MKRELLCAIGFSVFFVFADPCAAQSVSREGVPEIVEASLPDEGFAGGAFTPDGRIYIYQAVDEAPQFPTLEDSGWWVRVLRHEVLASTVTPGGDGIPDFSAQGVWSDKLLVEHDGHPPNWSSALGAAYVDDPSKMLAHIWLAVVPNPESAYSSLPVPFRSDSSGNYDSGGTFETYELIVVAPTFWPITTGSSLSLTNPDFPEFSPPETFINAHPMVNRRLQVVVSSPRTATAAIHSILWRDASVDGRFMQWEELGEPDPEGDPTVNPKPILAIEPSITLDGRLLLFQGSPTNNLQGGLNNPPPIAAHAQRIIMYSYNPNPANLTGWTEPRPLNELYLERATMIQGIRLDERYPLAAMPLLAADGEVLSDLPIASPPFVNPAPYDYVGAYPWITLDGTDLVQTTVLKTGSDAGVRLGASIIGQATGYKLQHIDGPLNPDKITTPRFVITGTGLAPGIWSPARELSNPPLPYSPSRLTLPLFDVDSNRYAEANVETYADSDYLVALSMNRMILPTIPNQLNRWDFEEDQTADMTAYGNNGTLESAAEFPAVHSGFVGEAVEFEHGGLIRILDSISINQSFDELSIEFFLKYEDPTLSVMDPQFRALLTHGDSVSIWMTPAGLLAAAVRSGGLGPNTVPIVASAIPADTWTHVAMTYDAETAELILYVDGDLVSSSFHPALNPPSQPGPFPIDLPNSDMLLGPGSAPSTDFGSKVWMDEFKVSQVARSQEEIRRSAYRPASTASTTPLTAAQIAALPAGLDPSAAHIPSDSPLNSLTIALGEKLFADQGLSAVGSTQLVSCASCHQPAQSFVDNIAIPTGASGNLDRNTSTTINRLFSTAQLFDGSASSLEEQAIITLEDSTHFGHTQNAIPTILTYLNTVGQGGTPGVDDYPTLFQGAYSQAATEDNLAKAIASYQRAIVSGDSSFDQFEAGNAMALNQSQEDGRNLFFGKARCFSCHSGPNFTDESFHITVIDDSDTGRFGFTERLVDRFMFKTPTLRNIDLTGPYFHDGSVTTLDAVIDIYDRGGDRTDGFVDREIFPLGLTPAEKTDLKEFLKTLTGLNSWKKL